MAKDQITPAADALANVHDYFPQITEKQKAALAKWSAFQAIVDAPFLPKEDAARNGTFFTVLKLGEGTFTDPEDIAGDRIEKWLVFVRLAHDANLKLRNGTTVQFHKGELAKIAMPKGEGLRDDTARSLAQILAEDGEIPVMQLKQLPPSVPTRSGAIVLHTPIEALL